MIVAYVRVSTSKQHLENQEQEIKRYALLRGLSISHWEMETKSGTIDKGDRCLGGVLDRLEKGDMLIVSEVSRLSRSLFDVMDIVNTCLKKQILLYSVKENILFGDNMTSKVMSFALGTAAEIERNLISARTREALALRKAQGHILGRKKGFCPAQAPLVKDTNTIRKRLKDGDSISSLASDYNITRNTMYAFINKHINVTQGGEPD